MTPLTPPHPAVQGTLRPPGQRIPTLDGWRALAIVLVLLSHATDSAQSRGLGLDIAPSWGLLGVQIFFGLSGLLITTRILQGERHLGQLLVGEFYLRRVFRILPSALGYLLLVGVLAALKVLPISLDQWLGTLLLVVNYLPGERSWYLGHYWSLAVEEHCYLLLPLLLLVTRSGQRRIRLLLTTVLVLALWRWIDFRYGLTGASAAVFWGRTDIQADSLLWGVLVALLLGHRQYQPPLVHGLRQRGMVLNMVLLVLGIEWINGQNLALDFTLLPIKHALIPLIILGTALQAEQRPFSWLEHPALLWLGRHAFGLYLYQQLFVVWQSAALPALHPLQAFPVNLLLALACAVLNRRYIEQPGIAWGQRLIRQWRHARQTRVPHRMESLPMRYGFSDSL